MLKDLRSSRQVATERIGAWPGSAKGLGRGARRARGGRAGAGRQAALGSAWGASGSRGGSLSYVHAVEVWEQARVEVAGMAGKLAAGFVGEREGGWVGGVDLAFLGALGRHVCGCARCGVCGRERDRPVEWLEWALGVHRELAGLWEALGGRSGENAPGWEAAVIEAARLSVAGRGRGKTA